MCFWHHYGDQLITDNGSDKHKINVFYLDQKNHH